MLTGSRRGMEKRTLTLGHSPDADDAFMFYALTHDLVDLGSYHFQETLEDIETLNHRARRGVLDLTAASVHAYAYLHRRYALMACGASLGEGCGPVVVARQPLELKDLVGARIAVPGILTTAYLALQLYVQGFHPVRLAPDRMTASIRRGVAEAGVLIHEGQLTYGDEGLHKVADLGELWYSDTGLPLPLGVNLIKRDLPEDVISDATSLLRASIEYALGHRAEALAYALRFSRGLDTERADKFVGMYVNEYSLDLGERGHAAIRELLNRAHERGLITEVPPPMSADDQ